ncbi:hypothetical protein [Kribbella deserti]|uniref:DUF4491 family protein n=1 Tax=Kribbella deserti TaxID=1926257 RepID=A0ABV6QG00_9ACTN
MDILLVGLGVFLLARASWKSLAHRKHSAWISAAAGPVALFGLLIDQTWPFALGFALFAVGEFIYQRSDEVSFADVKRLGDAVQVGSRKTRKRNRSARDVSRGAEEE